MIRKTIALGFAGTLLACGCAAHARPALQQSTRTVSDATLSVTLETPLNTAINKKGDPVLLRTVRDVEFQGTVIPEGTLVHGVVTRVKTPNRFRGAAIEFRLTELATPDAAQTAIHAVIKTKSGNSSTAHGITGTVFGALAAGAGGSLLGMQTGLTVAGGRRGTVLNAGRVGLGIGILHAITSNVRGRDINLQPGTVFQTRLERARTD